MKKIILSLLIFAGIAGFGQFVSADNASLSVSPASLESKSGSTINASINLDPSGGKVCVVKGTMVLDNLSCQAISLAPGVMAQTAPTCDNLNFVVGIPKCATTAQQIASLSVKGTKAGPGSITFSGVKAIGEGSDVALQSQGGSYTIFTPKIITVKEASQTQTQVQQEVTTPVKQLAQENNSVNPASANLSSSASKVWVIFLAALIILFFVSVAYYLMHKKKLNI